MTWWSQTEIKLRDCTTTTSTTTSNTNTNRHMIVWTMIMMYQSFNIPWVWDSSLLFLLLVNLWGDLSWTPVESVQMVPSSESTITVYYYYIFGCPNSYTGNARTKIACRLWVHRTLNIWSLPLSQRVLLERLLLPRNLAELFSVVKFCVFLISSNCSETRGLPTFLSVIIELL